MIVYKSEFFDAESMQETDIIFFKTKKEAIRDFEKGTKNAENNYNISASVEKIQITKFDAISLLNRKNLKTLEIIRKF